MIYLGSASPIFISSEADKLNHQTSEPGNEWTELRSENVGVLNERIYAVHTYILTHTDVHTDNSDSLRAGMTIGGKQTFLEIIYGV